MLDGCPEAVSSAEQLSDDDRRELVPYLALVLKLEQDKGEPEQPFLPERQMNGMPLDELRSPHLWHSFQPTRQIEAKKCALDLLKIITPVSLEALPDLLAVTLNRSLPQDFIEQVRESAFAVAARSAADWGPKVPEKVLAGITEYVGGEESFLAENLLFELQQSSVPYLVQRLKDSPPKKCDAVCRALLSMDPQGEVVGPKLIELLQSNDADLMMKVLPTLGRLPKTYADSLPLMITLLKSSDGLLKSSLLLALQDALNNEQECLKLEMPAQAIEDLLQLLANTTGDERDLYEKALTFFTANRPKAVLTVVAALQRQGLEPYTKVRLIRVLAKAEIAAEASSPSVEATEAADQALEALLAMVYDSERLVRLNAISASGSFARKRQQVLTAYLKLIKSATVDKDPKARADMLLTIAEGARLLSVGPQKALIPYMLEALSLKESVDERVSIYARTEGSEPLPSSRRPAAGYVLAWNGDEALPGLYKLAQSKDALLKERAAFVLGRISPPRKAQLAVLGGLLADESADVREQSRLSLFLHGKAAAPELHRLLKTQNLFAKLAAAQVLIETGQADASLSALINFTLPKMSCSDRARVAEWLRKLSGKPSGEVDKAFIECLAGISQSEQQQVLEYLAAASPLQAASRQLLTAILSGSKGSADLAVKIINRASVFQLEPQILLPLLLELAKQNDSEALRFAALSAIGELGSGAQTAVAQLKEMLEANIDSHLSDQVVLALSRIDPAGFDYYGYLVRKVREGSDQEASQFALALPAQIAVPSLMQATHELSGHKLYVSLQLLGDFGNLATDALPELIKRLESKDPVERYFALLAILRIDASVGPAEVALRRALTMPIAHELLLQRLPRSVEPLLNAILLSPGSKLERRNATILLQRLS